MQFEKWIPVDLLKPPFHALDIGMPVCTGDSNSVRLGVTVTSNGEPVDVTGAIKGVVILPNGLGLVPFDGAKEGCRAWIDLPEDALGMAGRITIAIRSFDGGETTVLLLASATVRRVDADQYYDPTDIVGDITDLIEDAEQAAQDAETALAQATQIVSYAEQTGKTDAQKAQARTNIGAASTSDVSDIKSAFVGYLNGVEKAFQGVASKVNKFDFLLLKGIEYTVTNGTSGTIGLDIWQADGTKKTITGQITAGNSASFTPDRDDYVQFGGWVNAAGTITISSDYSAIEKIADLEPVGETVDTITEEKAVDIPVTDYTETTGEYWASGEGVTANGWAWYKFPVAVGDSYTIHTAAGYSARAWDLLNSSNSLLAYDSYSGATKEDDWSITISNTSAAYLIVNCNTQMTDVVIKKNVSNYTAIDNSRIIVDGKDLDETIDELKNATAEPIGNILYGKTLVCCGDSITYGADMTGEELVTPTIDSYQYSAYTKKWTKWTASEPAAYGYQIAARNNMVFYNGGVSGACVQGSGGSSTVPGFSVADGEYTLLPNSIDYLTLFFGWNDHATGSLGTISDTTNASYYGGYNVVLPYLINKYPYAKIALIVPFGTDAGHRQAIRDLANKWGVACFDMMQGGTPLYWGKEDAVAVDSDIVTANRQKFSAQANSPHPNIHGHYQISTMLEHFLRGI